MFSLLLRQYDTVGELMRATENTYVIDNKTKEDAVVMWVALSRIRYPQILTTCFTFFGSWKLVTITFVGLTTFFGLLEMFRIHNFGCLGWVV